MSPQDAGESDRTTSAGEQEARAKIVFMILLATATRQCALMLLAAFALMWLGLLENDGRVIDGV